MDKIRNLLERIETAQGRSRDSLIMSLSHQLRAHGIKVSGCVCAKHQIIKSAKELVNAQG